MAVGNKFKFLLVLLLSFWATGLWAQNCGYTLSYDDNDGANDGVVCSKADQIHVSDGSWSGPNGYWEAITPGLTFDNSNATDAIVYGLHYPADTVRWYDDSKGCADTLVIYSNYIAAFAGKDTVACSSVTLSANNVSPGTGTWTTNASGVTFSNVNDPTATASNIPVGKWEFYWSVTYDDGNTACSDEDTVAVTNATPVPVDAGVDDTTCTGDSIQLAATPPPSGCSGYWEFLQGGGDIKNSTAYDTWVTNLNSGKNTLRWVVSNATCSDADTVYIYNYTVHLTDNTPSATTCRESGNIAVLVDPSDITGAWYVVASTATIDNSTALSTSVYNLNPGVNTFKFVVSDYHGCADSIEVTVNASTVSATASANSNIICNDTVILTGNTPPSGGSGQWSVMAGSGTINNTASNSTYATGLTKTYNAFVWTVTDALGCTDKDTVEVSYMAPDQAVISTPDHGVCTDTVNLGAIAPAHGTGYWTGPSGVVFNPDNSQTSLYASKLNNGLNELIWHVTTGVCPESTDTVKITYNKVTASASASASAVCVDTVYLTGNDPSAFGGTGSWSVIQGSGTFDNANSYSTFVTGLSPTVVNKFVWTVSNGTCSDADTVEVTYGGADAAIIADDTLYSCDGSMAISANTPSYGTAYWTATSGVTISPSSTDNNITATNLSTGTNILVWHVKNSSSCPENTDTVYVIYDNLYADAGGPYSHTCNGSINLSASLTPGATGTWSGAGVTFSDVHDPNATVSNLSFGANTLTWTVSKNGCSVWDTITVYNDAADPAVAGLDQHVCSNQATLAANAVTNGQGVWTTSTSAVIANSTSNITVVYNLDPGGNSFVWTVTNGSCSTSDTVIIYNDSVSVADAGTYQYICTDTAVLAANTPTLGSGQWTLISGGANFDDPTSPNTIVRNLQRGQNILQWRIYNTSNPSCFTTDTVSIYNMSVDAYFPADPVITCEDTAIVIGNAPWLQNISNPYARAIGTWTSLSGTVTFDRIHRRRTVARNLSLDTNLVTWTMSNGYCSDVDTLTIINNNPGQVFAGDDTVICSTEYDLKANPPARGTGRWYVLGGGGTVVDPTNPTSHVVNLEYYCRDTTPEWWTTVNAVNILEWTVTYNGCIARDTVRIINGKPGIVDAGDDTTVCDTKVNLYAKDLGSCAQEHWWTADPSSTLTFYNPYTGAEDNTAFNTHVEGLQAGITSFYWHKRNVINGITCELVDTVQITSLNLTADIDAGPDDAVCDTTYTLNATPPSNVFSNGSDVVRGFWTVIYGSGNFEDSSLYNTKVHNLGYTTNVLRWTVVNETHGCVATDDLYLTNALPSNAQVFSKDTVVCDNEANLVANRPVRGEGHWEVYGGTATITNSTCQNWACGAYAQDLQPGLNTFVWIVENVYKGRGVADSLVCALQDTAYVIYNQVIADAGDTMYQCADTAHLRANLPTANPPYVGQWSITSGAGTFATTSTNTSNNPLDTIRGLVRGKNTLTWTLSRTINGVTCSDADNLIIWDNLPPDPDAGADQVVCTDSAYLTANSDVRNSSYYDGSTVIATAVTSNYWSSVGGVATFNDSNDPSTWVHGLNPQQTNHIVWNKVLTFTDNLKGVTQQCTLTDTVDIFNNAVTAVAGDIPGVICGTQDTGAYALLNATDPSPLTGRWYFVSGSGTPTINNSTSPTTGVSGLENGDNIFSWVVSSTVNGTTCKASDSVTVRVRIPTTAVVAQPDSFEVCADSAQLQANSPTLGVGHWEAVSAFSGDIVNSTATVTTVKNLWEDKTKWVWVIDNDGCTSSDTITVVNNSVYADASTVDDNNMDSICVDTFQLYATDPSIFNNASSVNIATGQWSTGGSASFVNPTAYNTVVRNLSNSSPNVLVWTITKGGCSASSQITIYNNQFTIDAYVSAEPDNMATCEDSIQLDAQQPGNGGHGQWRKIGGGGIFKDDTLYNTWVTNLSTTDANLFEWFVTRNGCTASDTVTVISNKIVSQAGSDQIVCYDTTSLNAGTPPAGATGTWLVDVGSGTFTNANDPKTHVSGMDRGLNTFIWRVEKAGCTAQDTVAVTNNEPEDAVAEADKEVCANTATLVVSVPPTTDTGYWSLASGAGIIADSTNTNTSVTGLQPGVNKFTWTVYRGSCKKVDTLVITNNQVAANAGLDDTVCADTAKIAALGPSQFYPFQGTGTWSDAGGTGVTFDNPNDSVTIVRNLRPGANTLRWTVTKGSCSASDDIIITNRSVLASATDIAECNFPVTLTGNDPVSDSGLWKNIGGIGTIADPTLYNSSFTGLPNGSTTVLRWLVYNESCADSVDISVTNNNFDVQAGVDQTLCKDTAQLNAQLPGAGAVGTWSVDAGAGNFVDNHDPATIVTGLSRGNNVLRWTVDYRGCTNSTTVTITNNTPSDAIISSITAGCDSTATLSAVDPDMTYVTSMYWEVAGPHTFTSDSTSTTSTVKDLDPGETTVYWVIKNNGCEDRDTGYIYNNAVAAYAGNDQTVCDTVTVIQALDPTSNPPYQGTGQWTANKPVTIADPTNPITSVSGLPIGATVFTWTVTKGSCSASDQLTVYNAQAFASAYDTVTCSDSAYLVGNNPNLSGGHGKWTVISGVYDSIGNDTAYATTIYGLSYNSTTTIEWYVTNGTCDARDTITVVSNNFYISAGMGDTICTDNFNLKASDYTYPTDSVWWQVVGGGGVFDRTDTNITVVRNLNPGVNTLRWNVLHNGCQKYSDIVLVNNEPSDPQILTTNDTTVCDGQITLRANSPTQGTGYWIQIAGNGLADTATNNIQLVTGLSQNNNIFRWIVEKGKCQKYADLNVINNEVFSNAGPDDTICVDGYTLKATDPVSGATGTWNDESGAGITFADINDPNTNITNIPQQTTVTLSWTVQKGSCSAVDYVKISNLGVSASADNVVVCDTTATIVGNDPGVFTENPAHGIWTIVSGPSSVWIKSDTVAVTEANGIPYQTTAVLQWKIYNDYGCADSTTISVTNNGFTVQADPSGSSIEVCQDTYKLQAIDPSPGTGNWQVIGGPGKVTNSTLYNSTVTGLTSNPTVLRWTVTRGGCTAYDDVSIVNNYVPARVVDTTPAACGDVIALQAYDPTPGTGHWEKVVSSSPGVIASSTDYNTQISGVPLSTSVGLYWIVTNGGCSDSVQVTASNNNFALSAGPDKPVCEDTTQLAADDVAGATSSYWTVSSGSGTFDNSTLYNTVVRGLQQGANVLTWHVQKNGCLVTADVTITNNSVTANAGTDQSLCVDYTTLNGNDPSTFGGTGYWTVQSGQANFANSTLYNTDVTGLRRGSNTLRWTVSANGCDDFDDVIITNNSFDVDAGLDNSVCADTAALKAQYIAGGVGHWSVQGSSPAIIDNTDSSETVVRNLQQGTNTFRWTVTKNGCTFYDDVVVTNILPNSPVIIAPNNPDTVCVDTVFLHAQAPEAGVTGSWSYTGSGGTILNPNSDTTTVRNLNPGTTEFIWTVDHNGCKLSTSVVVVNGSITANAGADQTTLCQDYTSLSAVEPVDPGYGWWTKADGQPGVIASSTDANTAVTSLGYGENKFVWNVKSGRCTASDTVVIINNSASPAIVNPVPPTCDTFATLTATAPTYGTGQWSYIGTYPVIIESPNSPNTQVDNLEYGANMFKWTVTNTTPYTTCTDDTTLIVVSNHFTVDAGDDKEQCDSVFYLSAQTRPDQDSAKWTIVTGSPVIVDSTDANTQVYIQQGAGAILRWSVWEHGCYAEDLIRLQNRGVTATAYDQEVCDTTVNLQAVAPSSGNSGYWTSAYQDVWFDPDSSVYNATANGLHPGANQFVWHVYNDLCKDSTQITVNYLIPYAYAGADQDICEDYYQLSANDPSLEGGTGSWSVYSGSGIFDNSTVYNTTVRNLAKGQNILAWTVQVRACTHTDFVTINNLKPFVSVGEDQQICDSVTSLSGNAPDTSLGEEGYWTKVTPGPHWFEDSTNPTTKVYGIQPGSEIFRWTIKNGNCSAYADLIVTNNSVVANAGQDHEVCADSAQLSGYLPSNSTGVWSVVTAGPQIEDSTLFNTWVKHLNVGDNTFKWTVTHVNCTASDEVTITNNAIPANAGSDQTVCQNHTTLFGSLPPDSAYGVWRLVGGSGVIVDSTANVTQVTDLSSGSNVFSWTIYNGNCSTTDEVIIVNNELPVDAGADEPALCDNKFELNANPPDTGATGYWTVIAGYGEIDKSDTNITWVRNLARGENVLRWTVTKNGCSNSDEIVINNITPTQSITIGTKEICQDYTTITGNEPRYGVGHWKVITSSGAVTIDDSLANSTVVRNLAKGPNQFAWIIVDTTTGCYTSDTVTVYNNSVVSFAGQDREICVDTFKLEAVNPAPDSGYWTIITPGGKIDASDIHNPKAIVRDLPTGANILRWTVYNSKCSAYDDVILTNNTPTKAYAGEDKISCDGSATLIGNTPALDEHGLWIKLGGDGVISSPTDYLTNVTGLSAGFNSFIWRISRGSCSSDDTVFVDNHNILVDAGVDQTVCNVDTAVLRGNVPNTGVTGYWTLTGGQGNIVNSTDYQTVVRNLGPGGNTFRWTLSDGVCTNYDEVVVTNNTPTTPQVCYDTLKLCNDYTTLCANSPSGIETGFWTVAAGNADFANSNNPSTDVYNLSKDVVLLWHISKNGCEQVDTMYIFNGGVQATVVSDTLAFCGTDGYLAANAPLDTNAVAYWELISGSGNIADSTATYTPVSNLGLGSNIFRWNVSANGCDSHADMVVFNNKYPASANLAATNPICDSSVVVMGNPPTAGAIGQWSVASGVASISFDSPNSPTTVARNLGAGTSILKWSIIKDGCENYDTVVVINNSVYANAGADVTVCDTNEVASIIANDPTNVNAQYGYWSLVSGSLDIADTTAFATTVTHVAYGANTLKWTVVGNGCQAEDVVIVSNNHFTVSAGSDFTVCDTTAILTGTDPGPGGSGLWTVSGSGWFEDPTNYTTRVNGIPRGANTYIWTVHKNGCIASDAVVVTNGTPDAFAGGDRAICVDTFQLQATVPSIGTGTWTIVSGGGVIDSSTDPHSIVRNLAKGQNILRWTVQNGSCSAYDDVTLTNNMVTATAGIDQKVCDTIAYLAADPPGPGGHGVWSVVAGGGKFLDSTLYNTEVWGVYDGTNTYRWTVYENGCSNSTTVKIVNNRFSVSAGNDTTVFTPSVTLNADNWSGSYPYSGSWSIVAGGGVFTNAHDPNTDVNNLAYGVNTYRWFVTNDTTGCTAYDDVNVVYNGLTVDAGSDQIICKDSTYMSAQYIPNSTSYWSVVQGGGVFDDPTNPTTKVTKLSRGVNIFRWNVIKNGFATYDEVTVTNYAFDTYAGEDQDLCVDSAQLNAEYMYNYSIPVNPSDIHAEWQILSGGGNVANPSANQTTVTGLNPDANILRWYVERTDYPGTGVCSASDTVTLYYYHLPHTDFATVPDVPEGCSPLDVAFYNTTPTFDTIPGTKYYWNIANSALIQTNYGDTLRRTFVNNSDRDSIYPIWLISEVQVAPGIVCRDTAYGQVTVLPVPKIGFTAPIYSVYSLGFQLPIEVTRETDRNCDRYQWDFGDGTGIVSSVLDSSFNHPYNTWGTYTISLTGWRKQCMNSYSLTVHIEPPEPVAEPNSTNNAEGCAPLTVPLYAQVLYTTDGVSQYKWIIKRSRDSAVIAELHDKDVYYTFTDPGTYWVDLWVTAEGTLPEPWSWAFIRTDTIVVYPKPIADFTVAPMEVTVNELVKCYNYSKGATRYYWDFGYPDSSMTSTEFEPTVAYPKEGEYYITLRVESDHYCTDQKTLDQPVVVIPEGQLIFPDAFIPTSTIPSNRIFKPRYRGEVVEYELQIYNRWGQLIFVSHDVDQGWDGRINGQLAPQDVYAYKYRVKFRTGIEHQGAGSVTLLR